MSDNIPQSPSFNALGIDLIESIFSLLPIPSLVRSSAVCKFWRSIITSLLPTLSSPSPFPPVSSPSPWLFLFGIHNTSSFHNQSFAFDPLSDTWLRLPATALFLTPSSLYLVGSDKFLLTTAPRFSFSPILKPRLRFTSPMCFPRISPLIGVFSGGSGSPKFIIVGGVRFIGGLVDIEDHLPVEVYDLARDSWDLCPRLPGDFRSGNSYQTLSSALFKRRFYVFGIYSCFISSFCLDSYTWSDVQTLRPPGVLFSFLVSCSNILVLAGMCHSPLGFSFNLWKIDEESMEFSEIAIMPEGLLSGLVDNEDEDSTKFASLKCVGLGNLIYVFNEEYHKRYPACICEIDGEKGKCRWRRVPQLSSPVNKFHKVVSFCSSVSISDVFPCEEPQIGSTHN